MKNILLFIFLIFILGCDKFEELDITIKNTSEISIYAAINIAECGHDYSDYSTPGRIVKRKQMIIEPGESKVIEGGLFIAPIGGKELQWEFAYLRFFNAIEYDRIVDSDDFDEELEFSDPRFYLGFKRYTVDEIINLNWTITYPFEDSEEEDPEPEVEN